MTDAQLERVIEDIEKVFKKHKALPEEHLSILLELAAQKAYANPNIKTARAYGLICQEWYKAEERPRSKK